MRGHRIREYPRRPTLSDRNKIVFGLLVVVVGIVVALAASGLVHAAEAPEVDDLGRELYSFVPRGWVLVTIGQMMALGGVLVAMGGLTLAFVWGRRLTWARAAIGATLFTGLMAILFGVIPNQWLTLAQATLEWTPEKTVVAIPPALVLNNEINISFAALKDIIAGTYAFFVLVAVGVGMWWWQGHDERAARPKPERVSDYGRPLRVQD